MIVQSKASSKKEILIELSNLLEKEGYVQSSEEFLKDVYLREEEINLTKTEFLILEYFMKNRAISCSREKILTGVWGYDFDGEEKIVDVYINSLRKKMDIESKYIHTIRGFGYIFQYKED